jgi:hypothetical protein
MWGAGGYILVSCAHSNTSLFPIDIQSICLLLQLTCSTRVLRSWVQAQPLEVSKIREKDKKNFEKVWSSMKFFLFYFLIF